MFVEFITLLEQVIVREEVTNCIIKKCKRVLESNKK